MTLMDFGKIGQPQRDRFGQFLLVVSAALVAIVALYLCTVQMLQPAPQNPWESALLSEGWRIARHLPANHSLLAYGPFSEGLVAVIFQFTGPFLYAGRIISFVAAIITISLVNRAISGGLTTWCLLFAISLRTLNYFVEARPDMSSLLFAVIAVICFYRDGRWFYAGLAAMIISMLFKQTGAVAALVPAATLLLGERPKLSRIVVPVVTVFLVLALWHQFWPAKFSNAITSFSQYAIPPKMVVSFALILVTTLPLFWVCLAQSLNQDWDRLTAWLLAIILLTAATGILSEAKAGGTYNSLLPCLFAAIAFSARELKQMRWPLSGLAALLAVASLTAHIGPAARYAFTPYGKANYSQIVQAAKALPGVVTCPDDPFLIVLAKGDPRLSSYLEKDATGWKIPVPQPTIHEIEASDFVIEVPNGVVSKDTLAAHDFRPTKVLGSYVIWQRSR